MDASRLMTAPVGTANVRIGVDVAGRLPATCEDEFDALLSTAPRPPRPWVGIEAGALPETLARIEGILGENPVAASILASVLRVGEGLELSAALILESLAYSTLLGGAEFGRWRQDNPPRLRANPEGARVQLSRTGDQIEIRLAQSSVRNALGAATRDELTDALELAVLDTSAQVTLRGDGPMFCAGGDLNEFGRATDLAAAHLIRITQSPARLAAAVGPRLRVLIHGGAIGGGIEIAAAAGEVVADPNATFRLPEVAMGLIPGAGGTATIPRRIGRHRTAFMAMSNLDIDARQALDWGLADRLESLA